MQMHDCFSLRRQFHKAGGVPIAVGLLFMATAELTVAADSPVTIETGVAQLFIDDVLIGDQSGLKRTLHQPRKDNGGNVPLITPAPGATLLGYGTIVYDPKLKRYVMFMLELFSREPFRCTSADGMTWDAKTRDELQPIKFNINIEPEPGATGQPHTDLFSCYYDTSDEKRPYKGWIFLGNYGYTREGIYYIESADGLTWDLGRQVASGFAGTGDPSCRTIHQDGKTVYGPGDVSLFGWDSKTNRFLGLFKFYTPESVPPGNDLRSRAYHWLEGLDKPFDPNKIERIALLPAAAERNGDQPFDEYYATTAWRYESLWLGGLKVFHSQADYPYSAAGCAFLKFVVSRDGLNWHKVPFANDDGIPEVFIPNGKEGGNETRNDGGYISEFSQGPLRIGDELIYYYCASSYGKNPKGIRITGGGLFRARLRVDGFVSVDAGTLTTVPLKFEARRLTLNSTGPVRVEVLDADGKVLGQTDVTGDSLQHRVRFDGKPLRRLIRAGTCRLRFTIQPGGRLYSFTVR